MADLKQGNYQPVYLLMGEESFYIDQISDYIEKHALTEEEKSFNQSILYGLETDVLSVISEAKRFPMMAERNVVIIKEAQKLSKIEQLSTYLEQPMPSTVLVICHKYKKVDKRKALYKNAAKQGVAFESKKLYDNQVPDWINHEVQGAGYHIHPRNAVLMTEFLGNDLAKIANELNKLTINLPAGSEITGALIEEHIGISREFNSFELTSALAKRDVVKANRIVNYFAANEKNHPMVLTLGNLYRFFSKVLHYQFLKNKNKNEVAAQLGVNPFFVREYELAARNYSIAKVVQSISVLREYDLKSKGVNNSSVPHGQLLKEMVFRILH